MYSASLLVASSTRILDFFCPQAACMNLADRLTESPSTEYSLLEPLVPTTPA